jgi:hypothetical protein
VKAESGPTADRSIADWGARVVLRPNGAEVPWMQSAVAAIQDPAELRKARQEVGLARPRAPASPPRPLARHTKTEEVGGDEVVATRSVPCDTRSIIAAANPADTDAGPVVVSKNEKLTSDLVCTTLLVEPAVTLTTAGHNIYCSISVDNKGTIVTGSSAATNYTLSYGGSGAGATDGSMPSGTGRPTRSGGGKPCSAKGCAAGNGGAPTRPERTT